MLPSTPEILQIALAADGDLRQIAAQQGLPIATIPRDCQK
jgi:hypothetical protein